MVTSLAADRAILLVSREERGTTNDWETGKVHSYSCASVYDTLRFTGLLIRIASSSITFNEKRATTSSNVAGSIARRTSLRNSISTMPAAIALCKFIGTISLGLLTVRYEHHSP